MNSQVVTRFSIDQLEDRIAPTSSGILGLGAGVSADVHTSVLGMSLLNASADVNAHATVSSGLISGLLGGIF